jgi:hypothetical protein
MVSQFLTTVNKVDGMSQSTLLYTVNPALLTSNFVWLIQISSLHISLFKIITMKYFTQGKCEFMNFLFALSDKMKILTL